MGCTVRDKHVRTNRRPRPTKPKADPSSLSDKASISKSVSELDAVKPSKESPPNPSLGPLCNGVFSGPGQDESGWGYCTEEQLEDILMKNLEFLYTEAITRLAALGYERDVALKAVLRKGHCYGGMDVLTNILHNSLAYLNSCGGSNGSGTPVDESEPIFADLKQLMGYSLVGMVRLLQQFRPQLSNGDAMWCLLMCDLHVGRASTMEIPALPSRGNGDENSASNDSAGPMSPSLCRFHSGWGFGNGGCSESMIHRYLSQGEGALQREVECPKRFNLSPSMKSLLTRNVAAFTAGLRASAEQFQSLADSTASGTAGKVGSGAGVPSGKSEETLKNQEVVNSVLSKFRDLNLAEKSEFGAEDKKDEMIVKLLHEIKELEGQVKERKDWAHQTAMQAAKKLSNDLRELKTLRMEREETQRLKKGKQTLEDKTMKRLSEMENALRKASSEVDRANAAVKRLENENAEIRAEMEASKLSAAESVTTCLEVAKREKKCLKRLLAWEKQRTRLQEEIEEEKKKILEAQRTLSQVKQCQKEAESKWRQEVKAKEQASQQLEEERHLKESAGASSKRKLEALRLKIDVDFQRHKDDLQRLEQELSRLKGSSPPTGNLEEPTKHQGETIAKLLRNLEHQEDSPGKEVNSDRECIICSRDEVSIVFLPCAHQVVCAACGDGFGPKGKVTCPCCRVPIEQKIRVFGASS